jgi:Ca2+-binding EF-hand superfamily protein
MELSEQEVTEEDVNRIICEIDYETNGTINYTEFLAATIPQEFYVTDDRLKALFS